MNLRVLVIFSIILFGTFLLWQYASINKEAQQLSHTNPELAAKEKGITWSKDDPETKDEQLIPIGADFVLLNQDGQTVNSQDYRGKLMLVYFGFTHCMHVCPVDVKNLSDVLYKLGNKNDDVATFFISVDPARDTPKQLKSFLSNFHPSIIGLTGTSKEIAKVAEDYKVYYAPADEDNEGNYQVNHSALTFLLDQNGHYIYHFPHNSSPDVIANTIKERLK